VICCAQDIRLNIFGPGQDGILRRNVFHEINAGLGMQACGCSAGPGGAAMGLWLLLLGLWLRRRRRQGLG